ncbi:hypothetical protein K470DRAFT_259761 [Piedraia hortae CBS 480.64]|uniref:Uncharacterized protein n=1 Tax=Piedraia hortae CBS 480.64 TaxID=1314780 RepID=A0A6A7BVG3_9PEZI|nr:hypothetical protein K470DRAFT_259761 [Piedraia hortae CBS 480.64]
MHLRILAVLFSVTDTVYDTPGINNLSRPNVMVALDASYARELGVAILPTAFRRTLEAQK